MLGFFLSFICLFFVFINDYIIFLLLRYFSLENFIYIQIVLIAFEIKLNTTNFLNFFLIFIKFLTYLKN